MAALCARGRAKLSPLHWLSLVLVLVATVAPSAAAEGTPLDVEIRGTHHPARTTALPFYRRPKA